MDPSTTGAVMAAIYAIWSDASFCVVIAGIIAIAILVTLGVIVKVFSDFLIEERRKIQHQLAWRNNLNELFRDSSFLDFPEFKENLRLEKKLFEEIGEEIERETIPRRWMLREQYKQHLFLRKSKEDLRQSKEYMDGLLMHIWTRKLLAIADQQQDVPPNYKEAKSDQDTSSYEKGGPQDLDSTHMERSNAGQSGVTMASGVSGNIQDSTNANQTDNGNLTMDSVVSSEMIKQVAIDIGWEWKEVGRQLALREADLQHIHADSHQSQQEKVHAVFRRWQTLTKRPTYRVLANALRKAGRVDLNNFVEENYQKLHES